MAGAAIVSAVINKVVEIGATKIMEKSSRLQWLQEDIGWLERQMRHMQGYLENAEAKKVNNPNVVNLIKDIRDLVCDVEDILDIYLPRIESHESSGLLKRVSRCFLPYGWTSSEFSMEIEKIKRRVEGIDADRTRYGVVEDSSGTDDVSNVDPRTTRLHVDDPIIVGFEQHIEELRSKLEEHPFVSVVGMPGVGKTTLAKKVFKGIRDGFDCCASVSVSQEPNIASLMRDIAKQVGLEKEKQKEKLEENLYSFLQEKGGENSLHQLHPLDNPKSWELFSKLIVPTNEQFDSVLEKIGRQIVEKCGGVSLAIVVIVGMLREREMSEFCWKGVLHGMDENASDECSEILGLSYRDLPRFLKPCFLYFGNFPEDYLFDESEIIRLWMGEKFIPRVVGDWEPEDVGADYISKLEARNLIQVVERGPDGRVEKFLIHDLLHSFCVNIGREVDFLNTIDHLESSSAKRVHRLSVHDHSFVAENEKLISQMTKLRTLFHFKIDKKIEIKCLGNMLGRFKLLQVLKLTVFSEDAHIPFQIGSLSRLNYFQLHAWGGVEIPSSIRDLKNLQTLDFGECVFVKLPIGIWKMEQLRHILLYNYEMDSYLMSLLCKYQQVQVLLPNLRTLFWIRCSDLRPSWLRKFTSLRKLGLKVVTPEIMEVLSGPEPISKKLETLYCGGMDDCRMTRRVSLAKYERLMKLTLWVVEMQQLPELPPSLIKLTLPDRGPNGNTQKSAQTENPSSGFFSYNGIKMDCSGADSFPQLEILELSYLPYLEELIEGEEMGMPKLRELIIYGCDRPVRIPERLEQLRMKN